MEWPASVVWRCEETVLPSLWGRRNLARMAAVLLTTLAGTCLAYFCGPSHPFRAGQSFRYEIRSRVYFEMPNHAQTLRRRDDAVASLPPTLRTDLLAREAARLANPRRRRSLSARQLARPHRPADHRQRA